jgi:GNAT superfamily N-acetyltransferase
VTAPKFGGAYGTRMNNQAVLRAATMVDVSALTTLVRQLGYPAHALALRPMLEALLARPEHAVVVAEEHGVVEGFLTLSARPSLSLQGMVGSVDELVVRVEAQGRGIGGRQLQYAKGLATARGFVRLEIGVPDVLDVVASGFAVARGFEVCDEATYRWSPLESKHPPLPVSLGAQRWMRV